MPSESEAAVTTTRAQLLSSDLSHFLLVIYLTICRSQWSRGLRCRSPACWDRGSNPTGGMDVCLLLVLCVVRLRSLRRADHSSRRGVLTVVCCVWSRNHKIPRECGGQGPPGGYQREIYIYIYIYIYNHLEALRKPCQRRPLVIYERNLKITSNITYIRRVSTTPLNTICLLRSSIQSRVYYLTHDKYKFIQ